MTVAINRKLTGGTALVKALEANGVSTTFGIPGVHTLNIYDALFDSDYVSTILPRHEQGAGFMADGYARATGKPGVAIIVTGPGVTNVATPVGEAFADSSPVLVIATNLERQYLDRLEGNLHEMTDQLGFMRSITKWTKRVMTAHEIPGAIAEALEVMQTGRPRPVYLEIPLDVLAEEVEINQLPIAEPKKIEPDPTVIGRAVELIRQSNRVFILAGGGAANETVSPLLTQLAQELGAPVITSLMGKGAISQDHPYGIGAFGYRWSDDSPVVPVMQQSDLAIAVGTGLGVRTTSNGSMPLPGKLIHIDIDAEEIGKRYPTEIGIAADAARTLHALLEAVRSGNRPKDRWPEDEAVAVREQILNPADDRAARYVPYLRALRQALNRNGMLINDMTMMCYEGVRYYPVYEPRTYTFPRGFGTLGSSLPTAIGAKLGRPERQVVSVNGDGGFQFTMEEIGAVVHHQVPLPIVIFNDSTHTAVKVAQRREFPGRYIDVDLVNPDYVKMAEAYGIEGIRADSPDALMTALRTALKGSMPTIIDVPIRLEDY